MSGELAPETARYADRTSLLNRDEGAAGPGADVYDESAYDGAGPSIIAERRASRNNIYARPRAATWKSTAMVSLCALLLFLAGAYILSDWAKHAHTDGDTAAASHGHGDGHGHGDSKAQDQDQHRKPGLDHGEAKHEKETNYMLSADWDFSAPPTRRTYNWTISDALYNPDGVYRPMLLIDSRFPGPLIEVNEGDTVAVHVKNDAANSTSIHWHGLYQNGSNWMDGTVGVSSCAIAPGAEFVYEFVVRGQSGTYYYHAHHGVQSSDGLYGPLVVHARNERSGTERGGIELQKVPYKTDQVVLVADHYHDLSTLNMIKYLQSDRENTEPVPDGALINGLAIRDCSRLPHRRCDNATSNVRAPRFDLERGFAHRLRIVNSGAFTEFQISIDQHEFVVTEVDGVDVLPVTYHRLNINPGQRYSIVVNATRDTAADAFWLRAKMIRHCFDEKNPDLEPEIHAAVNYVSAASSASSAKHDAVQKPMTEDWPEPIEVLCRDLNTTELRPVVPVAAPSSVDATFYLRANFRIGAHRLSRGFFNSSSWRANVSSPLLFRALDTMSSASNDSVESNALSESSAPAWVNDVSFDSSTELVIQTRGPARVLDIYISNFDDGYHPFHLHGYKFFVLAQGQGYPPANLLETVDLTNPLRRDTASVASYGWMLIRLVADNPGAWALHCHVAWHTEAGLLMQLLTGVDSLRDVKVPAASRNLCSAPIRELRKGMTPDDQVFIDLDIG